MPMIDSRVPANATFLVSILISFATFDIVPELLLPSIFKVPDKQSYNLAFQDCGYEFMYSVNNLGSCYFMFNIYCLLVIIWMFTWCLKDTCRLCECIDEKLGKLLFWGTFLRLLFESYLELFLSVFVSLTDMDWSGDEYNRAVAYNNIFAITFSFLLLAMPFFILGFYLHNIDRMEDKEFMQSYGNIYEGMKLSLNRS